MRKIIITTLLLILIVPTLTVLIERSLPTKLVNKVENKEITTKVTNYIYSNNICDEIGFIEKAPVDSYKGNRIRVSCYKNQGILKQDIWVFFNAETGNFIEYMASGSFYGHPAESLIYFFISLFSGKVKVD